jgi:hypothetical protein
MIPRVYGGTNAKDELLYGNGEWCKMADVRQYLADQVFVSVKIVSDTNNVRNLPTEEVSFFISKSEKRRFIAEWMELHKISGHNFLEIPTYDQERGMIAKISTPETLFTMFDQPDINPFTYHNKCKIQ